MSSTLQAISSMPRAAKWGLAALVGLALYFGVIERTVDKINEINAKADAAATTVDKFAASSEPKRRALDTLKVGFREYGDVDFPVERASRSVAFNRAVDKVLADQKVSNQKSRTKSAPLGNGPLNTTVGPDQRVERMVRDIEFDATPEAVASVVAGLERSPVVATVSKVQVRQIEARDKSGRQMHASITVEAWILAPKKG